MEHAENEASPSNDAHKEEHDTSNASSSVDAQMTSSSSVSSSNALASASAEDLTIATTADKPPHHHHHEVSFEPLTPQTEERLLETAGGDDTYRDSASSPMMPRSDSIFSPIAGDTTSGAEGAAGAFPVVADVEAHQPPVDKPLFSIPPRLGTYTEMIRELLDSLKKPTVTAAAEAGSSPPSGSPTAPSPTAVPKSYFDVGRVQTLLQDVTAVFTEEQSLLELDLKNPDVLVVVGDVHGQFRDMLQHVLSQQYDRAEGVSDRTFLFLGDYVDRGPQGVETMLLLFALKIEYPSRIYLLRGNHEESQTSRIYGFLFEVRSKFDNLSVWAWFNEVFCFLPLAAQVTVGSHRFMAVHGGLSPGLTNIQSIKGIDRADYGGTLDNTSSDIVDGLLWSDPSDNVVRFARNERGCGYLFGAAATSDFCDENGLDFICRAHQLTMEGYAWTHERQVLTVFSAPNYCGVSGNKGALLVVTPDWELTFVQFQVSPLEEGAVVPAAPSFPQQRVLPWGAYFA